MQPRLRIGARASQLSVAQSRWVQRRVVEALGEDPARAEEIAPLVTITTTGDRIQDRRLLEVGGKQLFTKEIEEALLEGRVDLAVHSMKDVPADQPPGLVIGAVPEREDPRDAFVSLNWETLGDLPPGARLGTASLRRQAQTLAARPDVEVVMLRGNVDTRLRKLEAGECDAILLAAAGLNRLGLSDRVRSRIDPVVNPPAVGQGALALQCREADAGADWLAALHHAESAVMVAAERGALAALEGSCKTAVGAHARLFDGEVLNLICEGLSADGRKRWRKAGEIRLSEAADPEAAARLLGEEVGALVRAAAGPELIVA